MINYVWLIQAIQIISGKDSASEKDIKDQKDIKDLMDMMDIKAFWIEPLARFSANHVPERTKQTSNTAHKKQTTSTEKDIA